MGILMSRSILMMALAVSALWGEPDDGRKVDASRDPLAAQQQLEEVLQRLRRQREEYYEAKRLQEKRIEELAAETQALAARVVKLEAESAGGRGELDCLKAHTDGLRSQVEQYEELRTETNKLLQGYIGRWRRNIEEGIPVNHQNRLAILDRLDAELATGEAKLSILMELAGTFAESELRGASMGSSLTADVSLPDGRKKPARFFHLGRLVVGFVTEDGQDAGYARPSATQGQPCEWVVEGSGRPLTEIRDAVQILDRRAPPRLLQLPVIVLPGTDAVVKSEGDATQ